MNCAEVEKKITNLILGELPQEEELAVHEHIATCEHCLQIHIELSQSVSFLKAGIGVPEIKIQKFSEKDKIEILEHTISKSIPLSFRNAKVTLTVAAGLFFAFVILNRLGYNFGPSKKMETAKVNDDVEEIVEKDKKELNLEIKEEYEDVSSNKNIPKVPLKVREKETRTAKTIRTLKFSADGDAFSKHDIGLNSKNKKILPEILEEKQKLESLSKKRGLLQPSFLKKDWSQLRKLFSTNQITYQITEQKINGVQIIKIGQKLQYKIGIATISPSLTNLPKLEAFTAFKIHKNLILYKSQKEKSKGYTAIFLRIQQILKSIK